jgi:multidrug efflux system outer membrane protein
MKIRYGFLLLGAGLIESCSVGPDYHRPDPAQVIPPDWHWRVASPNDAAPKGPWWTVFHDPQLNQLECAAVAQNQDLKAAVASVDMARAQARLSGASFFPFLTFDPSYSRTQVEQDIPSFSKTPFHAEIPRTAPYNTFTVPIDLSYELDLWGRVRRSFVAAQEQAQASVADYQNVLLTLTSDVAVDYFTLRQYEREIHILQDSVNFRQEAVSINQKRLTAGRATSLDVAQAQTDYPNAQAELAQVEQGRAETQNALAALCGSNATQFAVNIQPIAGSPPIVPLGLPGSLLERRPDIAEAERNMAAKNEQIGVAYAAFFPAVSITGQAGYLSAQASDLFNWKNSVWMIGPNVHLPLFVGGENESNLSVARSAYDQSVARYRSSILNAFRDVETALADLHFFEVQRTALKESVQSADQAVSLSQQRFSVGEVSYTDVVLTDETRLSTERNEVQVQGQQFYATIRLIKALGGGWSTDQLTIGPKTASVK